MKFKQLNEADVRYVGWYDVTPGEPAPTRIVDNINKKYFSNFKVSYIKRDDSKTYQGKALLFASIAINFSGGEMIATLCEKTCDERFHDFQVRWFTSLGTWKEFNQDMKELNEIVNTFKKKSTDIFKDCFEGL